MSQFSLRSEALDDDSNHRFLDPISLDIMNDPVRAADGHTYERASIQEWFRTLRANTRPLTSPLTNQTLASDTLTPNEDLMRDLLHFKASKSEIKVTDVKFTLSSDIYKELDRIASFPLMEKLDLKPPKIIVIGNESHGKSTLLERIIGLPLFPKEKGICTRCVIRVHLRRCPADTPAIAEITTVSTLTYGRPPPSPLIFTALDNIREKIQYVMDGLVKNDKQRRMIIDDHEIVVKLQLPYCLNLDILDVPGLVTTTPTGVTQNLPQVTHDLAMKIVQHEKESSIYLLVNDIRVPPNQSRGCAVIQQAKVENQTLGVFTKLDTFVSEDGDEVHELEQLLTGKAKYSFPVKGGWIAAASKKPADFIASGVKSELSLFSVMNRKEDELFTHKFSTLLPYNILGMDKIRQRIQSIYEIFIQARWVPVITRKLQENLNQLQTEMYTLGSLLPPDVDYFPLVNRLKSKNFHSYQYFSIYYFQSIISHLLKRVIARTDALGINLSSEKGFWAFITGYHKVFEVYNNCSAPMYSFGFRGSFHKTFDFQGQKFSNVVKPHEVPEKITKMENYVRNEIKNIFEILSHKLDPTNPVNVKGISDSFRRLTNIAPTPAVSKPFGSIIAPTPSNFSNFNQFSFGGNLPAAAPFSHPQSNPFVIGTSAAPSSPSATTATSSINTSPIKEQEIQEVDIDNFVLSRFPKIMTQLEIVIAERLAQAHSVFVNWFTRALTTFPDCLVIVEYFNEINSYANTDEVKACLHWSKPETLQQYPHIIINKWYECLYQHFEGIEKDFTLEDFTNLVESCKERRVALLKQINDNLEVQSALTVFSQKFQNKAVGKGENK
jgi:hypothetical protein